MLNHSSSSKKGMHVVWDEDNLKQNEEIQKEYSAVRISEPKTPYRPPLPSDSLEDDMKPLQLDEGAFAGHNSSTAAAAAAEVVPASLALLHAPVNATSTSTQLRC